MTDAAGSQAADRSAADGVEWNLAGTAVIAALVGVALAWPARSGAVQLLVAVAALQALFAFAWVFGLRRPGRNGGLIIAAMAAGASDTVVSVWPRSGLGALLAVFALAVPVLFVHQLSRGAARVRVLESLGGVTILVVCEVALPAMLQLRHEFTGGHLGGQVSSAVAVVVTGGLLVGCLVDLVLPAPRFDPAVPRGLPAVLASAALGAALGYLTLRSSAEFIGGRAAFVGAGIGAVAGMFAVAAAFVESAVPLAERGFARRVRPVIGVLLPLCLVAPVAFLLCLAVRT